MSIETKHVIRVAKDRLSDGTNPEYDRAIVEMVSGLLGRVSSDVAENTYLTAVLLGVTGQSLRALDPEDEPEVEQYEEASDEPERPVCSWQEVRPQDRPMWARIACTEVTVRGVLGGTPLCTAHVEARDAQWAIADEVFHTDEAGEYALSDCRWWDTAPAFRPATIRSVDCSGRMGMVTRTPSGTTPSEATIECEAHFNVRRGWSA